MPSEVARLSNSEATDLASRILDAVQLSVVGKRQALELMLLGLLTGGHVLIEDFPGLAKTLMARSLAQVLGVQFKRVQFTPDLMPSDVTGSTIFNPQTLQFEFRPGPIFTNILLADEINRAPAKTQAALLEAMQEGQVTVDGRSHPLPELFTVLATQNPIEYEGTYPLPEAQLDRFLLRIAVGYPAPEEELEVLRRRIERRRDELPLDAISGQVQVLALREVIERVHVDEGLSRYVVALVGATRSSPRLQVGASPRGSLALLKLSRGLALLRGRDFVVPEDVKALAVPALAHRLTLKPELWVQRLQPEDVVWRARRRPLPIEPPSRPRRRLTAAGRLPRHRRGRLADRRALRPPGGCGRRGAAVAAARAESGGGGIAAAEHRHQPGARAGNRGQRGGVVGIPGSQPAAVGPSLGAASWS